MFRSQVLVTTLTLSHSARNVGKSRPALCVVLATVALLAAAALSTMFLAALLPLVALCLMARPWDRGARHDRLTGLADRQLLARRTTEAIVEARSTDGMVALFILDLDRFTDINDTLGHRIGDRVLQCVAARLDHESGARGLVARLSGDEFAVLLPRVAGVAAAHAAADRVRRVLEQPFHLDGTLIDLDASIGVALSPHHADDFELLLQRADVARQSAKAERSGIEVYAADRDANCPERLGLLSALRRGVEEGELELYYQPKVSLGSGRVVGVEALVRWVHPTRGLVQPDEFIPLAEQSGMMHRLTDAIIEAALAQAAQWWADGMRVPVAVNVSMRDLLDTEFAARLANGLCRHGLPGSALSLEITERVIMADLDRAAGTLDALGGLGIRLSLDDFGTGYSSLLLLKRLPVSELKVDRTFVQRVLAGTEDAAIVRSITELAHALGLVVVAEGVETPAVRQRVRELGCDYAQGWQIGLPMTAEAATCWLYDAARRATLRAV
jgi:diguanylate cyclase (GGDEF)-like protein